MNGPEIRIGFQLGPWPRDQDRWIAIRLDEYRLREASRPLDYFLRPNDGRFTPGDVMLQNMICTPPEAIRAAELDRAKLAEAIGRRVAAEVLRQLSAGDTLMGYPKNAAPRTADQS